MTNEISTLVGAGLAATCAAATAVLAVVGTSGGIEVSRFFADKQKNYPNCSWQACACKVASWAALSLGFSVATFGSVLFGPFVFLTLDFLTFKTLTPITLALGVASATILEVQVLKKTIGQASRLINGNSADAEQFSLT